ncbi:hypothetical protein [Zavarzinella formosa]|uniref:hypothetical protein n=1 Tax=Zavarzinella formosa TaxID=360055 RepID=UPI00030AE443|nr:hypothetical protein [Zavarzinella formosa]
MESSDSLKKLLLGATPKPSPKPDEEPAQVEDAEAISLADMNGSHSMRPSNKTVPRIHVVLKDGKVQTLFYHHLDAKAEYDGNSFTFLFIGAKHWELTVQGRNLWRVYDYISLSRWPYIRVSPRDYDEKGEVVTAVSIKDITPRSEE